MAQGVGAPLAGMSGSDAYDFQSDTYYYRQRFYQNKLIGSAYASVTSVPVPSFFGGLIGSFGLTASFGGFTGTLNDAGYSEAAQITVTTSSGDGNVWENPRLAFFEWGAGGSGRASTFTHYWTDNNGVARWMTWGVWFVLADTWTRSDSGTVKSASGSYQVVLTLGQGSTYVGNSLSPRVFEDPQSTDAVANGARELRATTAFYPYAVSPNKYYQRLIVTIQPRVSGIYNVYLSSAQIAGLELKDLTVSMQVDAMPANSEPPANGRWDNQIRAAISMPSGGGAPRLCLLLRRMYVRTSPYSGGYRASQWGPVYCVSHDFGESFRPGQSVGPQMPGGTDVPDVLPYGDDPLNGAIGGLQMVVLPTGRVYVNGSVGNGYPGMWKAPRISDDISGKTWRNAQMLNGAQDARGEQMTQTSAAWTSRGAYAGSKGAGGRTGGAWMLMGTTTGFPLFNSGLGRISHDGGETWDVDAAMKAKAYVAGGNASHIRGISYYGPGYSNDDGRTNYTPMPTVQNPDDPGPHLAEHRYLESVMLWTAGTDVTYLISHGGNTPGGPWEMYKSRKANFRIETTTRLKWSPAGDGTGLVDLSFSTIQLLVGYAWNGRVVLVGVDPLRADIIRAYVSDNDGDWFRQTCWTNDSGRTWQKYA